MSAQNTERWARPERNGRCPVPGERVLDSACCPWTGLRVVAKQLGAKGQLRNHVWPQTLVALVTRGHARLTIQSGNVAHAVLLVPASLVAIPAGYEVTSIAWTGAHEQTLVMVPSDRLAELVPGVPEARRLVHEACFAFNDRILELLMRTMRAEVEAGCPSGTPFGASISSAFAARLLAVVGKPRAQAAAAGPTLTSIQQKRVLDYIRVHLSQQLGLAELARLVEASPSHFARAFRHTFGMPPYRYVIEQRILEAKRLMSAGNQSISEIALLLGFSSQSHFTATFRKVTGTTPKGFLGDL